MSIDVDLLRNLLLRLELRQLSPRSTVIIATETEAEVLGTDKGTVTASLNWLQDLGYIEGPGEDNDAWFFRKLTQKGTLFVDAMRDPEDWERMKYAQAHLDFAHRLG